MRKTNLDLSNIPEAGVIRKQVIHRHRQGLMNIIQVIGLPGTGKSWCSIRLGELFSLDLHGENLMTSDRIVDSLLGLLKAIRGIKKRGEIIVIEEAAVLFSSRRAMSGENVDAGKIFDTLRKKGAVVIMNFPVGKDVDSRLTRLCSMSVQTLSLNKAKGVCISKALKLQTNPASGKVYRHRLRDKGYEVHRCWTGVPDKKTTNEYENSKDKFLEELYEALEKKQQKKTEKLLGKVMKKHVSMPKATEKEERVMMLLNKGHTYKQTAEIMNCHVSNISQIRRRFLDKQKIIQDMFKINQKP